MEMKYNFFFFKKCIPDGTDDKASNRGLPNPSLSPESSLHLGGYK